MSEELTIKFQGLRLDISIDYTDEDDLEWSVSDVNTPHTELLDLLLHENHNQEVIELILEEFEEQKQDAEMERQLSNYEDKHGRVA